MAALPLAAQTVTFSGQVRERSEADNRSSGANPHVDVYHYLRTRLAATATINEWLTATVEVQDSRTFGQTKTTFNTGSPDFDLRQGNIEVKDIAGTSISLKLGRQVISYANERLLGRSDWNNTGQSFDGAMASVTSGDIRVDAFGAALARYPNTPDYHRDAILSGLWGTWKPEKGTTNAQLFYIFDSPGNDTTRDNRHTAGAYVNGSVNDLDFEVDGAYQFGMHIRKGAPDRTIAASLVGLRAGYTLKSAANLRIGLGFDMLSGLKANDPNGFGAFNTLYGTNHRFYGHLDVVDNTTQRQDLGLSDPFVQISVIPWANTRIGADLHLLSTMSDPKEIFANLPSTTSKAIGKELDLTINYTPVKAFNFTAGFAVLDGDPDRYLLPGRKTLTWGFGMMTVSF
ncbi:MAG: alginate export family protein [Bacteroidetes bacterium]|nr:alginate export family protein [Bacteroidota bacterium]